MRCRPGLWPRHARSAGPERPRPTPSEGDDMRFIGAASLAFALAVGFAVQSPSAGASQAVRRAVVRSQPGQPLDGRTIFRFDTFGDEQLWTDVLRMHEVLPTVAPATALAVGLKVDSDALPSNVIQSLRAGTLKLDDPALTVQLLRLNAVIGVVGTVTDDGQLTKVGVTCALCHSTVDDAIAPGVGQRLDGWANTDL